MICARSTSAWRWVDGTLWINWHGVYSWMRLRPRDTLQRESMPFWHLMLFGHLARIDESADARRILTAVRPVSRTSSHLVVGQYEERPIIPQPQCGRCHRAGTGQTTLKVIGSKRSYAVKWCKPNNDDDEYAISCL